MKQVKIHAAWIILLLALGSCNSEPDLGIFEGNDDIGNVGPQHTVPSAREGASRGGNSGWSARRHRL